MTNKPVINFNFDKRQFTGIQLTQAQFWQEVYQDISIDDILTKAIPAWLDANPTRAPKKNWKRFIVNWLTRAQRDAAFLRQIGG